MVCKTPSQQNNEWEKKQNIGIREKHEREIQTCLKVLPRQMFCNHVIHIPLTGDSFCNRRYANIKYTPTNFVPEGLS